MVLVNTTTPYFLKMVAEDTNQNKNDFYTIVLKKKKFLNPKYIVL